MTREQGDPSQKQGVRGALPQTQIQNQPESTVQIGSPRVVIKGVQATWETQKMEKMFRVHPLLGLPC